MQPEKKIQKICTEKFPEQVRSGRGKWQCGQIVRGSIISNDCFMNIF